ncbi:MAG: transcription elongation GreA/GreB family factor [Oceanicoccus sp.]|jgi:transcription elongation GreA/GreB family factor
MYYLVPIILKKLERELETAIKASMEAHSSAIHSENIADNRYGTLALEAAYLAHGQSVRIDDLQTSMSLYKSFHRTKFTRESEIGLGALVDIESSGGDCQRIFLGPAAGGLRIEEKSMMIQVITSATPLGKLLFGKYIDDDVELAVDNVTKHYSIVNIQ